MLEGTWAYFLLSIENNEQCFSGTIGWWWALAQKELPQKHYHEKSKVQATARREKD